jgi:competence protein ComEC
VGGAPVTAPPGTGPGDAPRAAQVEQLDVGQGDAAWVETLGARGGARSLGMIDAGSERALSDRAWLEVMIRRGTRRLDWVALTHLDEDHAGGLKRIALLVEIGCVATAREQLESERGRALIDELERRGVRVTDWDGACVPYPVLGPGSGLGSGSASEPGGPARRGRRLGRKQGESSKANGLMSAILVPLQGGGFYLSAGDADVRDEPRIGAWAARAIRAEGDFNSNAPRILKVSHHGSRTSSDPGFLRAIQPTEAWISSGAGNRYGHPSASVLRTLERLAIPARRTDEEGVLRTGSPRR